MNKILKSNIRASLDRVVVYGCPPVAIRICNLVSLKSLPATPLPAAIDEEAVEVGAAVFEEPSGIG